MCFNIKLSPDRNGAQRSKGGKTFLAFEWSESGTVQSRFVRKLRSKKIKINEE